MHHTIAIKQLILWRHADAEFALAQQGDMTRALTSKGNKQSRLMATWLNKYLPKDTLVLVSPALRALQTAEPLNTKIEIVDALQPETSLQSILSLLSECSAESVMLIGHQPWIGELIALLLSGQDKAISVKKGAVWWLRLSQDETGIYKLFTVQTPQLLD
ncbi:MAG: phosphohistidine phosphatase SixA [Methylophilus sp.]|nr:phosphohistidine phosphatase SixA [Methylophilus sp.]